MTKLQEILQEAAKLPPAEARRILAALSDTSDKSDPSDPSDPLDPVIAAMETAMIDAVLDTLKAETAALP